jgi:hypothetical protein
MSLFYIIGAGPSYLDVTEEEWKYLEDKHTISFARVPYGSRKTEYYLSIEHSLVASSILPYMAKLGWFDINLLLYNQDDLQLAKQLGFKHIRQISKGNFYFLPSRKPWFEDEAEPPNTFQETMAKNFHLPLFRFRGQLSAVINSVLILGATEIRLIGIDMNDQWNFYDRDNFTHLNKLCKDKETVDKYLEYKSSKAVLERESGKVKFNINYNPSSMHTCSMPMYEKDKYGDKSFRGIIDIIQWIDKEMKKEQMEGIYTTSKNSLLYIKNKLEYRGII